MDVKVSNQINNNSLQESGVNTLTSSQICGGFLNKENEMTKREKMKNPLRENLKLLAKKMDSVVFVANGLIDSPGQSEKELLILDEIQMDINNLLTKLRGLI